MFATGDLNALAHLYASNLDDAAFGARSAALSAQAEALRREREALEFRERRRREVELHLSRGRALAIERRLEELRRLRGAPVGQMRGSGEFELSSATPSPARVPASRVPGGAKAVLEMEREQFEAYVERSARNWGDEQVHTNDAQSRALRRKLEGLEAARRRNGAAVAAAGSAAEVATLQERVARERQQLVDESMGVAGVPVGGARGGLHSHTMRSSGYSSLQVPAAASPPPFGSAASVDSMPPGGAQASGIAPQVLPIQIVPIQAGPIPAYAGTGGSGGTSFAQGETAIHIQQEGGTCNIFLPARPDAHGRSPRPVDAWSCQGSAHGGAARPAERGRSGRGSACEVAESQVQVGTPLEFQSPKVPPLSLDALMGEAASVLQASARGRHARVQAEEARRSRVAECEIRDARAREADELRKAAEEAASRQMREDDRRAALGEAAYAAELRAEAAASARREEEARRARKREEEEALRREREARRREQAEAIRREEERRAEAEEEERRARTRKEEEERLARQEIERRAEEERQAAAAREREIEEAKHAEIAERVQAEAAERKRLTEADLDARWEAQAEAKVAESQSKEVAQQQGESGSSPGGFECLQASYPIIIETRPALDVMNVSASHGSPGDSASLSAQAGSPASDDLAHDSRTLECHQEVLSTTQLTPTQLVLEHELSGHELVGQESSPTDACALSEEESTERSSTKPLSASTRPFGIGTGKRLSTGHCSPFTPGASAGIRKAVLPPAAFWSESSENVWEAATLERSASTGPDPIAMLRAAKAMRNPAIPSTPSNPPAQETESVPPPPPRPAHFDLQLSPAPSMDPGRGPPLNLSPRMSHNLGTVPGAGPLLSPRGALGFACSPRSSCGGSPRCSLVPVLEEPSTSLDDSADGRQVRSVSRRPPPPPAPSTQLRAAMSHPITSDVRSADGHSGAASSAHGQVTCDAPGVERGGASKSDSPSQTSDRPAHLEGALGRNRSHSLAAGPGFGLLAAVSTPARQSAPVGDADSRDEDIDEVEDLEESTMDLDDILPSA